jgi:hypothetical protein
MTHSRKKKDDWINIIPTEDKARSIMLAEINIWNKYGWGSGGEIESDPKKLKIYEKELQKTMKKLKIKKLPNYYYNIFEDANWHLMNTTLDKFGYFEDKEPYTKKEADIDYKKYKSLGGKTWELT